MAFCDLDGNRKLAEEFLKSIITAVLDRCRPDLEFFNQRIDNTVLETLEHVASSDFAHISYTEAVRILEKARDEGRSWEFPVHWGANLQSEHERYLTEEAFKKPVIVTDYPKEIKAFYMRRNEDVLLATIREQGLPQENYWWYLELRKFGTAPHAGFGLGLERMMMYLTGMKNIRDVIPFPRTPGYAEF